MDTREQRRSLREQCATALVLIREVRRRTRLTHRRRARLALEAVRSVGLGAFAAISLDSSRPSRQCYHDVEVELYRIAAGLVTDTAALRVAVTRLYDEVSRGR